MEDGEDGKPSNPVMIAAPAMDQNGIHVYPDWAAMQAYYGHRLAVPPYLNSVATSHAPPPYMWAPPQSMIPPYGAPYAAFYAHGGIYPHPGVHMGGTALSMDKPAKTFGNTDGDFVKKLKEFDGLAMSMGNKNRNDADNAAGHGVTKSEETEGSSDGSKASNSKATWDGPSGKKRSRQGSPNSAGKQRRSIVPGAAAGQGSEKVKDVILSTKVQAESNVNMNTALELKNPSKKVPSPTAPTKLKDVILSTKVPSPTTPTNVQQPLIPSETWLQSDRELKRERRKQSNRESARRSRLRKQADAEELSINVLARASENTTLKSELTKLMKNSEKLKLENATLMEKLKDAQKTTEFRLKPVSTVNLLARVHNNSNSIDRSNEDGDSVR